MRSSLLAVGLLAVGCGSQPSSPPQAVASSTTLPATAGPSSPSSPTTAGADHPPHEEPEGLAAATVPIDPQRRAALALPDPATPIDAAALLPLTSAQWSDPEIVAARFLLVQANHSAAEDPFVFAARRAAYTSPTLARQLELAGAGAAPLAKLRATDSRFHGDVVGLASDERTSTTATVAASVRHWRTSTEGTTPPRISFYALRLVLDHDSQGWLVVDLQIS